MRNIMHLVRKEIHQIRRDRKMIAIMFVSPIMQLVVLGYAANLDVREIPLAVLDYDRSAASRELTGGFFTSGYFVPAVNASAPEEIDRALDRGTANIALVIPRGFGTAVAEGAGVKVQILADGSDSTSAGIGLQYARQIVRRFGADAAAVPAIEVEPRIWYNPQLESRNFLLPGILALLLMVMTTLLTSLAIVREKERGTLEQISVTPIRPLELILGKLIPFAVIGCFDVVMVVLVVRILFGLPLAGSFVLLFVLSLVFLLTTLGLGLFISTVSANQQQAMMTAVFFVLLPMIYLSGFVFPIENMPPSIRAFSALLPLRYYFVIIRGIFLKGAGIAVLWDEGLILLAFGIVILGVSTLRFRKTAV